MCKASSSRILTTCGVGGNTSFGGGCWTGPRRKSPPSARRFSRPSPKGVSVMPTEIETPDRAPGLERCFLFDAVEESYEITGITGRVPEWLRGSYYVNGPARFERAGRRYKHWLDGDGMVCSLRFTEQGVRFTSRFVATRKIG